MLGKGGSSRDVRSGREKGEGFGGLAEFTELVKREGLKYVIRLCKVKDSPMKLLKRYLQHLLVGMQQINKEILLSVLDESPDAKVLDIGCNDGFFTRQVANKIGVEEVVGIEIDRTNAFLAHENNDVDVVLADANRTFPFKDNCVDIVVSNQVIEHLHNTDNFIKEIYRVLRPHGYCIVSTPNLAGFHNILSLLLGYQPPTAIVSDEFICGNPLNPVNGRVHDPCLGATHKRIFTAPALKALFQFHGFDCESLVGCGLQPLPLFISKRWKKARYAAALILKARKPRGSK